MLFGGGFVVVPALEEEVCGGGAEAALGRVGRWIFLRKGEERNKNENEAKIS